MASDVDILVGELRVGFEKIQEDMASAELRIAMGINSIHRHLDTLGASAPGVTALGESFSSLGGQMVAVGTVMSGISAGITYIGVESLKTAGMIQQAQVAMTTFTGSMEKSGQMIKWLVDFAIKTPFEIKGLLQATRQLIGFGFELEKTPRMLQILGDAVAATGEATEDRMRRIVLAFGAIQNRGTLALKELNQLGMLGIPGMKALAEEIDKTTAQLVTATKKRAVDGATAIEALLNVFEKKYAGAMEAQSKTFLGMLSNLADEATKTYIAIGEKLLPLGEIAVQFGFKMLQGLRTAAEAFTQLPVAVQASIAALVAAVALIGPVTLALGAFTLALVALATPVGLAVLAIGAIGAALVALAATIAVTWPGIVAVFDAMKSDFAEAWNNFTDALETAPLVQAFNRVVELVKEFAGVLSGSFTAAVETVRTFVSAFTAGFTGMFSIPQVLIDVWNSAVSALGAVFNALLKLGADLGLGMLNSMGFVGQAILLAINAVKAAFVDLSTGAGRMGEMIKQSFIGALPGIGPIVLALKAIASEYGGVFTSAMQASGSTKSFSSVIDELRAKMLGAASQTKHVYEGIDKIGASSKKTGKDLQEAGNQFLAWVAHTEAVMAAELRYTTVKKQEVRTRLDLLRDEIEGSTKAAKQQLDAAEILGRTEIAYTGVMSEETRKRIQLLKDYIEERDKLKSDQAWDSAAQGFEKMDASVKAAAKSVADLNIGTKMLLNQTGWKGLGDDLLKFKNLANELGRELKTSLDLEDPLQRVQRMWGTFNKMLESGMLTAAKSREIYAAVFESTAAAIEKASQNLNIFQDGAEQFFGVKLANLVYKTEAAWMNLSRTVQDSVSIAIKAVIIQGEDAGKVFTKVWHEIRDAFKNIWKTALAEVADMFATVITNMVSMVVDVFQDAFMSALRGIIGQFVDIDNLVGKITKRVSTELVPAIAGDAATKTVASTVPGAVTSARDTASGVLGSGGLMGALTGVSSALTAVFSGLQYLQGRRMEQDIGRIEVTTRQTEARIRDMAKDVNDIAHSVRVFASGEIVGALSVIGDVLHEINMSAITSVEYMQSTLTTKLDALIGALGGANITVSTSGDGRSGDVFVSNYPMFVDPIERMRIVLDARTLAINDSVLQRGDMLNTSITNMSTIVVSALQVGFKSVINAVIGHGGSMNANINVQGNANIDRIGQQIQGRLDALGG